MGTDIHPVVEVRRAGAWARVDDWGPRGQYGPILTDRNYQLFAVLANQRNGFGFAGVPTGEAVRPIAEPRGFPEDFKEPAEDGDSWMGDHSFTWVTLRELNEYPWDTPKRRRGVISLGAFKGWDRRTTPTEYSGSIFGPGIFTISQEDAAADKIPPGADQVYVAVSWDSTIGEHTRAFCEQVLPWLNTLGAPDDVRLVMGFDS